MYRIGLRTGGFSRQKYVGAVDSGDLIPSNPGIGPEEVFDICHSDGTDLDAPLLHGARISIRHSGQYFDFSESRPVLSDRISDSTSLVIEKYDISSGKRIVDGDHVSIRSERGWLTHNLLGLGIAPRPDPREIFFLIYSIPHFSGDVPIGFIETGEGKTLLVKLDREAPPGGILVSLSRDPEGKYPIQEILVEDSNEGTAFPGVADGLDLRDLYAQIACTGEISSRAGRSGKLIDLAWERRTFERRRVERRNGERRNPAAGAPYTGPERRRAERRNPSENRFAGLSI